MNFNSPTNSMVKVVGHKTKVERSSSNGSGHQVGVWVCDEDHQKYQTKMKKKKKTRSPHFYSVDPCKDDELQSLLQHDLYEFFNRTTISGFLQIVTRKRCGWRIFWACVSILGIGMSFYQSQDVLTDYFSGKTIQIIRYNNVPRVPFPSLTVCSNVRLNHRLLTPGLVARFCNNRTSSCSRTMRSTRAFGQESDEEKQLRQRLIEYQLRTPIQERRDLFYGSHKQFLLRCSWKGVQCNISDHREVYFFSTLLHGQCFTFNLGMNYNQLGRESREFIAVLNMDRRSRKLKFNDLVANFWLHPPGTSPGLYSDNAGRIFPGDKTRLDFSMQTIKRLGTRNCFDSRNHRNRALNPYYSHSTPYIYDPASCIFHHEILQAEKKGCFHATVENGHFNNSLDANSTLCTTFDCLKLCINLTDEVLDNIRWPQCKSPCGEYLVRYGVNTMSLLLENVVEESLLENSETDFNSTDIVKNPFARIGAELRNRTVALLQLSPEHNIVEDITEENKYSVADFLGILGGNIGLWVGVSIISLAEFVELIYIWIVLKISTQNKNRKTFLIKKQNK